MKRLLFVGLLWLGIFFSPYSQAAVFNVTDSSSFQAALTTAQANGENDTINLAAGTYTGPFTYQASHNPDPDEGYSLTIAGASQNTTFITNPGSTALSITGATITVSGITFQDFELALDIADVAFGDPFGALVVSVTDCVFEGTGQDVATSELGLSIEFQNEKLDSASITITGNTFENIGNSSTYYGAGVHIETNSSGTIPISSINISENTLSTNYGSEYGAGMYIYLDENNPNTAITISNNTFSDNISDYDGGGAYIENRSADVTLSVTGNTFHNNEANNGGGMYFDLSGAGTQLTIGGSESDANTFTHNGGGNGNAIYLTSSTATGVSTISHNIIGGTGENDGNGSTDNGKGAVYASILGNFTFQSNTVINNSARRYAGAYFEVSADHTNTASINISNNAFTGNQGFYTGGGLGVFLSCACSFNLNSNLISGNQAQEVGGAYVALSSGNNGNNAYLTNNIIVNNQGTESGYNGGGLYLSASDYNNVNVINNTIAANSTTQNGGGAYFDIGTIDGALGNYDNIFWGNTAGGNGQDVYILNHPGAFAYNDVTNVCTDSGSPVCVTCSDNTTECDVSSLSFGENDHNVGANPEFQTGTGSTAAAYNLLESSPIISLGIDLSAVTSNVEYDYYHNPRPTPSSSFVAMGAIQYVSNPILSVDPASKDYGTVSVGSSTVQTFTLSNIGNATLTVSNIAVSDTNNFTLNVSPSTNPCGSTTPTLSPNGGCNVEVTFNPTAVQTISANLSIASNASNSPTSVALSGSATNSACTPIFTINITAPSGEIDVGENITWVVTMSNTANCASDNTIFSAQLSSNQEAQSGVSTNSSLPALSSNSGSVNCSVSGVNIACGLGTFGANSSMTFNIISKVTAPGTLSITGNVSNQEGTATASALATATAGSGLIAGTGCSLNKMDSETHFTLWLLAWVVLLPAMRLRKKIIGG